MSSIHGAISYDGVDKALINRALSNIMKSVEGEQDVLSTRSLEHSKGIQDIVDSELPFYIASKKTSSSGLSFIQSENHIVGGSLDAVLSPENKKVNLQDICELYTSNGLKFIQHLNGQFLLFIYDKKKEIFYFIRDRFGIEPFYYYKDDSKFIFGQSLKSILRTGVVEKAINKEALWHSLSFPSIIEPLTIYQGIHALEKGSILSIDKNGVLKIEKFHSFDFMPKDENISVNEGAEELTFLLRQATERKLRGKEQVSSLLSGGLDSTFYSVIANEYNPKIDYLTLGMKDPMFSAMNEHEVAALTAKQHSLSHHIDLLNFKNVFSDLNEFVKLYEQPANGFSMYYFASRYAASFNSKYLISGLGVDEMFGGNNNFSLLNEWRVLKKLPFIGKLVFGSNKKLNNIKKYTEAKDILDFYLFVFSTFSDADKRKLWPDAPIEYSTKSLFSKKYQSTFKNEQVDVLTHLFFDNTQNDQIKKMTMFNRRFGMEPIYPFFDNDIAKFISIIPKELKVVNKKTKIVLRQAANGLVHSDSIKLKKMGFSLPIKRWATVEMNTWMKENITKLKQRDLFDNKYIDSLFNNFAIDYKKVLKLVFLELWFQENMDA